MFTKFFKMTIGFLAIAIAASAQANLIIAIDNTGANDPVNVSSPRVWNFAVTQSGAAYFQANGITFDSALFDAKIFKNTTDPLIFTLYSGLGGNVSGNSVVVSGTHSASLYNQQYTGGDSLFTFYPESLTAGYYSVTLTSAAPATTNQEYFVKTGLLTLLTEKADGTLSALDSQYWLQDKSVGNASTTFNGNGSIYTDGGGSVLAIAPEPNATLALIAITGISFGGAFVRRMKKSA